MRVWREEMGLSQTEAAARLGTPRNNWARWERGHTWPDRGWRARIVALIEGRPKTLGEMLQSVRETHAILQTEAAAAAGVSRRTWQAWENGEYPPSARMMRRLYRFIDRQMAAFR